MNRRTFAGRVLGALAAALALPWRTVDKFMREDIPRETVERVYGPITGPVYGGGDPRFMQGDQWLVWHREPTDTDPDAGRWIQL